MDGDSSADARAALRTALVATGHGDRRAFALVYQRTSAKLFGVCLRILGSRNEAEDALQEAYVNVWRKAAGYDPAKSSPISWLAALARNKAIDRLRARGTRAHSPIDEEAMALVDPAPSATDRIEAGEDARRLGGCIDELEDKQRGAIRAAFFDGATYSELATRGGVPLGTMKSWVRRGLMRLKECLER